jgi:hypothetical protein
MANISETDKFNYPAEQFMRRTYAVRALQYDGEPATAYEILAWIHRLGHTGSFANGYLQVGSANKPVKVSEWVLSKHPEGLEVWTDADFQETFASAHG